MREEKNKIITLAQLKIGQTFEEIPKPWYGKAKLTYKKRRDNASWSCYYKKIMHHYVYDIKFDAAVVNPPGIEYDVSANTKIRLLKGE